MGNINWQNLKADFLVREAASFLHFNNEASSFFPLFITICAVLVILLLVIILVRFIYIFKTSLSKKSILLELTPPAFTEKTSYTTTQLFSVIHELGKVKTIKDRLLGKRNIFSFEIVSSKNSGVKYLVWTSETEATNVKRSILSYLPQVRVKEATEYLQPIANIKTQVVEFKLDRHFAYPLKKQDVLDEHDPIAYITGMMTKLSENELMSFQIVLTPIVSTEATNILRMALSNKNIFEYLNHNRFLSSGIFSIFGILARELSWAMTELIHGNAKTIQTIPTSTERIYNSYEQQEVLGIEEKVKQPLFEASLRLLIATSDATFKERRDGLVSSFASFSIPQSQSLSVKFNIVPSIQNKIAFFNFQKRRLSAVLNRSPYLFSVSEVSGLFHFPYKRVTQTEDLVKAYSKDLPAPLSLKTNPLDIVFGINNYGGSTVDIGLTKDEREKHMYIIGATGTGKSTMILSMVNQDINRRKGLCLIDPHGDLAESAINCIPKERKEDFIYFNPDDIKFPIGLNLLELPPISDSDELLREKELITESVVSLFRKIFSDVWSAHAHRLEYILRNTIQTALCLKEPTIFTVYNLLTDPEFQKKSMQYIEDENLKNFWKYEFGKAGDFQKVKMIGPITSRIGRFLFSPSAKRILEQPHSTIDFDQIIDQGKILICNLSKGRLGEDTSEVLGIMILTKIQLASLKRARMEQQNRKSFYVYVDEFQTFATPSFIQMLSESRKYKVHLIMAEQSTSQQKDRNITNVIIANVGTVISFRSANPDDEKLMLPQFAPNIEPGEISNLPSFKFYMKVSANVPEEPFSGQTVLTEVKKDKTWTQELINSSRNLYAKLYVPPDTSKSSEPVKKQGKNEDKKPVINDSISVLT